MSYGSIYTVITREQDSKVAISSADPMPKDELIVTPKGVEDDLTIKTIEPIKTTEEHIKQFPTDVTTFLNADPFLLQSELMTRIGSIITDCFDSGECDEMDPMTCHAIMHMKFRPEQKRNFLKYTVAFAKYAFVHDNISTDAFKDLVGYWWDKAKPSQTDPPYSWFDDTKQLGPQLISIAMCAMTMIRVVSDVER